MPDFSTLDNQDHLGNAYYPSEDCETIIEVEIWDEIVRALLNAVQVDPSTEANNTIEPEGDFPGLTVEAFPTGDQPAVCIQSLGLRIATVTASSSIDNATFTMRCENTTPITITLPPLDGTSCDRYLNVYRGLASNGIVSLAPAPGDSIETLWGVDPQLWVPTTSLQLHGEAADRRGVIV